MRRLKFWQVTWLAQGHITHKYSFLNWIHISLMFRLMNLICQLDLSLCCRTFSNDAQWLGIGESRRTADGRQERMRQEDREKSGARKCSFEMAVCEMTTNKKVCAGVWVERGASKGVLGNRHEPEREMNWGNRASQMIKRWDEVPNNPSKRSPLKAAVDPMASNGS